MPLRLVLFACLYATLTLSPGGHVAARAKPDSPVGVRFGVVSAQDAPAAADELGITWEQVTFDWAAFQPSGPDDFVTRSVDADGLDAAASAGRDVVGLVVGVPRWASASGKWSAVPDGLNLPAGDLGNVWAAFIARLVTYYAPRGVHHWIISEEPNVPPGEGQVRFAGGVDDYARLLRAAFLAASAADPDARILVAGMNHWADVAAGREPYLARLLAVLHEDADAAAHGFFFDAVIVRAFDRTQAVWDTTLQARTILDAAGLSEKPLWLVTNASPTLDPSALSPGGLFGITPEQQADFVIQAVTIGLALGVERMAIDRLVDTPDPRVRRGLISATRDLLLTTPGERVPRGGLVRADGSRRPAFDAYRVAIGLAERTISVQLYSHFAADLVVLTKDEQDVYVLWAKGTDPATFVITSGAVGEPAMLAESYRSPSPVLSGPSQYPAAYVVPVPGAAMDPNGFLAVAGLPQILRLDRDDFYRVIYLDTVYGRIRLK